MVPSCRIRARLDAFVGIDFTGSISASQSHMRLLPYQFLGLAVAMIAAWPVHGERRPYTTVPPGYVVRQHLPLTNGARLELLEDARITSALRKDFTRGLPDDSCSDRPNAAWRVFCLEIHDHPLHLAQIRVVARTQAQTGAATLERPVAELSVLDSAIIGRPIYVLTVDLSAEAGSYSGPYARLMDSGEQSIHWLRATDVTTHRTEEIRLPTTLKTGWRLAPKKLGGVNDILLVACRPDFDQQTKTDSAAFVITYTRFSFSNGTWSKNTRAVPGFWENDGAFPDESLFPR
jgi:hypothetical protein